MNNNQATSITQQWDEKKTWYKETEYSRFTALLIRIKAKTTLPNNVLHKKLEIYIYVPKYYKETAFEATYTGKCIKELIRLHSH